MNTSQEWRDNLKLLRKKHANKFSCSPGSSLHLSSPLSDTSPAVDIRGDISKISFRDSGELHSGFDIDDFKHDFLCEK